MTDTKCHKPKVDVFGDNSGQQPRRSAWLFSLPIFAMVGAMLIWNAHIRYREFETYQQRLMESSVNGTAAEVGVFISELRRSVHLFADKEDVRIDALAANPEDLDTFEQLGLAVRTHFPESFAYTIADNSGQPLIADFDGLVGEICVRDMQTFATNRQHSKVYIHPHPTTYHFDVMVYREHGSDIAGVFFVSFTTDILARILKHGEMPGHRLMLLKQDIPGLIEVASEGVRIDLQREFKLNTQELSRIRYSVPIDGTSWELVDLPDPDLYTKMLRNIQQETVLILITFVAVGGAMLRLLSRSQAKRRRLEYLYHHDAVTGLPNRYLFLDKFAHLVEAGAKDTGSEFAVLLIDIGPIRRVKGSFLDRHPGDALYKEIAARLERAVCAITILARIDEVNYAVLLSGQNLDQVGPVSNSILTALQRPFGQDNETLLANPCVGAAIYPMHGRDLDTLMRHARVQIYSARQPHRN